MRIFRRRKSSYSKEVKAMQARLERLYRELDERPHDTDLQMEINGLHLTLEMFV